MMSSASRRFTSNGGFGKTHIGDDEKSGDGSEDCAGGSDIDIDFSVTESGRTVAHLVANVKDDDGMDFGITESGRTVDKLVDQTPDCLSVGGGRRSPNTSPAKKHPNGALPTRVVGGRSAKATRPKPIPAPEPEKQPPKVAAPSAASSFESSGSAFINGLMNPGASTGQLSHTPPAASSYEVRHFGKRPRSGSVSQSVSGRLRSASDLEDKGIIDSHQKGVLKDLIITGDDALQRALDKYEKGDRSELEKLIKSGALADRVSSDIDLMGELDLDFLTVEDESFGEIGAIKPLSVPSGSRNTRLPVSSGASVSTQSSVVQDDGIGDLDFNGFVADDVSYPSTSDYRFRANSLASATEGDTRLRSNSLAYGALANELPPEGQNDVSMRWTDRDTSGKAIQPPSQSGGFGVGSTGIELLTRAAGPPPRVGGIAESLEAYGRSLNDNKATTKAQQADQKRRQKQLEKQRKEREKQEKRNQKEREKQLKKELKERNKQDRNKAKKKQPKTDKMDDDSDMPKVIESGTGRPRSQSDPNLKSSINSFGLLEVERPDGWVGAYSPESRKMRIERFMAKRTKRVWKKSVKYDVRKNFADSRLRVKGRFVKKEDELMMRELMSLT